jgi:hypothetical protein
MASNAVRGQPLAPLTVSKLKGAMYTNVLNMILLSNIVAERGGIWGKPRTMTNYRGNILKLRPGVYNQLLHTTIPSRRIQRPPRTSPINEDTHVTELSEEIHSIIYTHMSPLIKGKTDSEARIVSDEATKYTNINSWFPTNTVVALPTQKDVKAFLKFKDVVILNAFNNELDISERNQVHTMTAIPDELIARLFSYLDTVHNTTFRKKNIIDNTPAQVFIQQAKADIEANKNNTAFIKKFTKIESYIPVGTHFAYTFSPGFIHHALYIGSGLIIEVLNVDTSEEPRRVKGFITINHIDHFMQRTMNNTSDCIMYTYNNKFPDEVIRNRAAWSLGQFPNYHITEENCESFVLWALTNSFEPTMCVLKSGHRLTTERLRHITDELTVEVDPHINTEAAVANIVAAATPPPPQPATKKKWWQIRSSRVAPNGVPQPATKKKWWQIRSSRVAPAPPPWKDTTGSRTVPKAQKRRKSRKHNASKLYGGRRKTRRRKALPRKRKYTRKY